jgi:hypothetical protein
VRPPLLLAATAALGALAAGCSLFQPYFSSAEPLVLANCGDPLSSTDVRVLDDAELVADTRFVRGRLRSGIVELSGVTRFGRACRFQAGFVGSQIFPLTDSGPVHTPYLIGQRLDGEVALHAPPILTTVTLARHELVTFQAFHATLKLSRGGSEIARGGRVVFYPPAAGTYTLAIEAWGPYAVTSFHGLYPPGMGP